MVEVIIIRQSGKARQVFDQLSHIAAKCGNLTQGELAAMQRKAWAKERTN